MTTFFAAASEKVARSGKRRICFPITSRAYYGRSQLLIRKLHSHPDLELELMLGGSILLDKYSRHIAEDIEAGGFTISASLFNVIEGGNHVAMAKTACLTALEFTNGLHAIDPDAVVLGGAMNFGGPASALGRDFLERIRSEVRPKLLEPLRDKVQIEFASLGGDAGYIGAAGLARLEHRQKR